MGGYGSGRSGWRGVIEGRRRADIRMMRRRRWLIPGAVGSLSWFFNGEPLGEVSYRVGVNLDHLELLYNIRGDDGATWDLVQIRVPITRVPCRYGGERTYWRCPRCWRRCEVIVMASGGHAWGCRTCLGLRYTSQGLDTHHRLQHRADSIYARLGGDDGADWIPKPPRMRWRTFNRLMDQANELAARADGAFALRAAALLDRWRTPFPK